METDYSSFLFSLSGRQWKRIGASRRAGIAAPLFSIYSKKSIGLGEIPDIKLLIDWCKKTNLSIIQLLPLNDTGFNFTPYDTLSAIALDPMYISLENLKGCEITPFENKITLLRKEFPAGKGRVNYAVKGKKLELLWEIYIFFLKGTKSSLFQNYKKKNSKWLNDYALYKVLKETNENKSWEEWPERYKNKEEKAILEFSHHNEKAIDFHKWLQWQLCEQFTQIKKYAASSGILIMGDLPFLVSKDSADVWSNQKYFKLDLASGAPPDLYFAGGQRWGMPPYNWDEISSNGYDCIIQKLKYAENFFDLYRIDHFVGIFRIWTVPLSEPLENSGLNGFFDPPDENIWKEHGRRILDVMLESVSMLPCAEDLGTVPDCSFEILDEYKIPGMDVQRWTKNWGTDFDFKKHNKYRKHSVSVISTHDMSSFCSWWKNECGTIDEGFLRRKFSEKGISFNDLKNKLFDLSNSEHGRLRWREGVKDLGTLLSILERKKEEVWEIVDVFLGSFTEKNKYWNYLGMKGSLEKEISAEFLFNALKSVNETDSIFSIQLLQDWLLLGEYSECSEWEYRINVPGSISKKNWSIVSPVSLEKMQDLPINKMIQKIVSTTNRT